MPMLRSGYLQMACTFHSGLNNQYHLVFFAEPKRKGSLQRIKIYSEKTDSEIAAPRRRLGSWS